MRKSKAIKKLLTALTATVLGTAFAVSSAACAHKHTFYSDWTADENSHWHAASCAHKDEKSDVGVHIWGLDDVCDTCGYDRSTGSLPAPADNTVTVSFETAGGTVIENKTVEKGSTLDVADPVRGGYTFEGWYSDEDLTVPFVMKTTTVTTNLTLYAHWLSNNATANVKKTFTVSFNANGGTAIEAQTVTEGNKAVKPADPERAGYQFLGWFNNSDGNGSAYGFTGPVQGNLTLYAKWQQLSLEIKTIKAYNESLAVEWSDGAPSQASVQYKATGAGNWLDVDSELVRSVGNSTARVDVVGLAAGEYDVKINPSSGASIELAPITVTAHDRSGYAHFQRKSGEAAYEGIGAYKDDGTLKDNAIVIYITEQNKDTVMDDVAAKYDAVNMFKIPNHFTNKWENKNASGIGWWLNNAQYSKAEKDKNGNVIQNKSSNTYDPNGNKLGFSNPEFNCPVVLRFIGTVTTPEGCTEFNSLNEGGSVGDNGHMARMKNFKNITLEGIGEDAVIEGWGFHFMRGNDATGDFGTSFEARNLTFNAYPEDALGMEGVQGKSGGVEKITASVERCWIHNNTFLPGHCANPAESDKKEGDGSCDFKRGMYYTLSYNIFEYCHKTNLVGSSDDSLQFNVTMHHNMWYNCGSRIPLLRKANIHYYNNYIFADSTDPKAGGEKGLSYVHSLRAESYMFSEANYYDGCKQVTDGKSGGDAKGWNNMYISCFGGSSIVPAETREEVVDNKCEYLDTSFKTFDTDPALFYYDAQNHVSDCLLDDPVTARAKVIMNAGANGTGAKNLPLRFNGTTLMNKYAPTAAVDVPEEGELDIDVAALGKAKKDAEQHGILFRGLTGATGGAMKFRGQGVTFMLAAEAAVTITATTLGDAAPSLISANGSVIAKFESTLSVTLPAGVYVLVSGQKDKDSNISKLSFASTAGSAQAKIENLTAAINALPETVTVSSGTLVNAAKAAANALNADELANYKTENAELWAKYQKAVSDYNQAQIDDVIAKIGAIGTVDGNSYPAINAARTAYDGLSAGQQALVTNFSTLEAAENAWASIAVTTVNQKIAELKANYGVS
ncbi:MAG: InlB B-repeat-containing protein, partial [Ruminococcus flavefaciens]|nr:InlB B-repeat-containing protein [Ruminococcus flavefaciens]